jgi:hypothetical protein
MSQLDQLHEVEKMGETKCFVQPTKSARKALFAIEILHRSEIGTLTI